jgi:hypothetical protein
MGLSLLHAGLPSGSAAPAQVVPLFTGVKGHHVTLARNGIDHVQQCTECECVSSHLGPTTVRIDAMVLGEAAAAPHAQRTAQLFGAQKGLA